MTSLPENKPSVNTGRGAPPIGEYPAPRQRDPSERAGHHNQAARNKGGVSVGHSPRGLAERAAQAAQAGGFLYERSENNGAVSLYRYEKVVGDGSYVLRIQEPSGWPLSCDCPVGARSQFCKHQQLFIDTTGSRRPSEEPLTEERRRALIATGAIGDYHSQKWTSGRLAFFLEQSDEDLIGLRAAKEAHLAGPREHFDLDDRLWAESDIRLIDQALALHAEIAGDISRAVQAAAPLAHFFEALTGNPLGALAREGSERK